MGPLSGLWVPIRYERLPEICSFCGLTSHSSRDCALLLQSDCSVNHPHQYGDWLRFTGKGMLLNPILLREDNNMPDSENPQIQRLAIEVSLASIPVPTVNELPRPRYSGIRIIEPVEVQVQQSQPPLSPTYYSLSGAPTVFSKGKEKVIDVVTKVRSGRQTPAFLWRLENSNRQIHSAVDQVEQRTKDPWSVTTFSDFTSLQSMGLNAENDPSNIKAVVKDCNRGLSINLLSIFKASEPLLMGLMDDKVQEEKAADDVESDP